MIEAFVAPLIASAEAGNRSDLINISSVAADGIFPRFGVYCGTKAFVTELHAQTGVRAQVGVQVFDGRATLVEWQAHSLDIARLHQRLDALASYSSPDRSSTNLYGAVIDAVQVSEQAQAAFRDRNHGGAFTVGHLVLFTDGSDTAGYHTKAEALAAVEGTNDDILAVGLSSSADYDRTTLREFSPMGVIDSPNAATLSREFRRMATRIAGQARRTYLLGYCSPKRAGAEHNAEVAIAAATSTFAYGSSNQFSAVGFAGGCTPSQFVQACAGQECGGLGCGACDDSIEACVQPTGQCVSHCVGENACDGRSLVNDRGYEQQCVQSAPGLVLCGGLCVDLSSNPDQGCGAGGSCQASGCVNALQAPCENCSGTCVDTQTDASHCGACGDACGTGGTCVDGGCTSVDGGSCSNFYGTCTTAAACQSYGQLWCTYGGFPQWPLPGTPQATRGYATNTNTVIDSVTNLEWQRAVPASSYTWTGARNYCSGLTLDGRSDWRLPSTIELMSLVDYGRAMAPYIDPSAFPSTPSATFWGSHGSVPELAWRVDFSTGRVNGNVDFVTGTGRVRCVR